MPVPSPARTPRHRRSRRRTRRLRRGELIIVAAIVGAGAVAGGMAGAEPTGWAISDALWQAVAVAGVAVAATRARRWTWISMAGAAAVVVDGTTAIVAANIALAVALAAGLPTRRQPVVGAAVASVAMNVLLRASVSDVAHVDGVVAAIAATPVLWSAVAAKRASLRRRLVRGGSIGLAVVGAITGVFGITALLARGDVEDGIAQARSALELARDGKQEQAAVRFRAAQASFGSANDLVDGPWNRIARVVPGLGSQARALSTVTADGRRIASAASAASEVAPIDDLKAEGGAFDIALLESFAAPLERLASAIEVAADDADSVDSPLLIPPIATRVDRFSAEIEDARSEARLAADAIAIAPDLLGARGPRTYFVAFTQPAEARGLGGFMGSWAELEADGGRLDLTRSGRARELNERLRVDREPLTRPADYVARYGKFNPHVNIQDVPFSPDFPSVARVLADLYPRTGGDEVDGVLMVDPYALAALMRFTGPIDVPGLDGPLRPQTAADYLVRDQYVTFDDENRERIDVLADATAATFEALTEADLPSPRAVADRLHRVAAEGRLALWSRDGGEQAVFRQAGVANEFPEAPGDLIAVVGQNAANNKIDIFLERTLDYAVSYERRTGALSAVATIRLTNRAPQDGLPDAVLGQGDFVGEDLPVGTNRMFLTVYSPHRLTSARLDGQTVAVESQREFGLWTYSVFVNIASGATREIAVDLEGALEPRTPYSVGVAHQPLVRADAVTVSLHDQNGRRLQGGDFGRSGASVTLEHDVVLRHR